ncbi:Something about silencing protein [Thalictrum thalictroides]|uniref:Something about silencing protein n=1 Tax=Thalictrum thalictroides TaxID=46969 RepID=A0A7J6WAV8_THATH|nr:Something about silencing protein [Thalictrum thalictroides]
MRYLETKQLLLLAYCQAISFYLLLKSEGHPVIARLVEIKNLLDKMKELDEKLPSELEEILNQDHDTKSEVKLSEKALTLISEPVGRENKHSSVSITKSSQVALPTELISGGFPQENGNKQENGKKQIGLQSMEMLKVRASLEEKLKQKGVFKNRKVPSQPASVNSRLESIDDFGDAVIDKEEGNASSMRPSKLTKLKKLKVVSGDDDLLKRDDIGERRRKHELRVLANAGVKYNDEVGDEPEASEDEPEASEDELIKQAKRRKLVKLSKKAELYSRTPVASSLAEPEIVDGKRQITRQILKNRGLTRSRNKLHKNPRSNYKRKHEKKVKSWKGAARSIKKPTGPSYDGEHTGINPSISRSTRFK